MDCELPYMYRTVESKCLSEKIYLYVYFFSSDYIQTCRKGNNHLIFIEHQADYLQSLQNYLIYQFLRTWLSFEYYVGSIAGHLVVTKRLTAFASLGLEQLLQLLTDAVSALQIHSALSIFLNAQILLYRQNFQEPLRSANGINFKLSSPSMIYNQLYSCKWVFAGHY